MGDDKVLTAGFTYHPRITLILSDILTYCFPDVLEYSCTTSKMDSGKIRMVKDYLTGNWTTNKDKINNPVRNTGFLKNFHQDIGRINLCVRSLPNGHITHQDRCRLQVSGDRGKIEWR